MRNLLYILFFVVGTVQAQTKMTSSEAKALKEKVKALALTTNSIVSDFTQYKHMDFLSEDIVTKGNMAFKSPDLLKWAYEEPFKYQVIFKNETLYIDDEGKKSNVDLGSNKMFKELNALIVKSVKGDMFDDQAFDISYFKVDHHDEVYFAPKDTRFSKFIKTFQITFNEQGDVVQVKMVEPSGEYTKIVFSNKVLNAPLDDKMFAH
ncbi:outer membrane lipoprotein carrier protein LolA [Mangrovimonas sp. DI 80]|uniref:LolA family protein n=1 Tax=Mangrovimonas sp. DI 80 TaxID=1779330 RepID=UPI000978B7FD|nr:outer membrane lipoprotein carrier protein LolA [Mangrovimonas sp. DI 80]OMP31451.1 cell envelope biogenesis protein LolA [Mangrovimonas sp. DI 80]